MTRRATLMFGMAALFVAPAVVRAEDDEKPDLVGAYSIVRGEREGKAEPAERVKGTVVTFSEDRLVVVDKESHEIFGATYTLDTARKPWKISMTSKLGAEENKVARGLIEKDGDKVRLIYSLPGTPEPKEFKTAGQQLMFELKRIRLK